ncbi:glycosyltransferase family 2 protein [Reyranella sp. CPCC 100927]|uniref:glycosyltransferase family 2 protein n=1 Tax=Reyranella sp. CPCC 100927 TaxID=2599616 RepID=UPI0011B3BC45|nr:glycosyltransferase family 2 protein [Reyranella sp. CPCC 100927]TWS99907.1 glycosyltransferase family 2 protein [Reyranella sp. CPCC 100927]
MKRPFALSIVVPVYNGAASVGELVAALRALEVPGGLEVVLVNDGSPDNSFEVCRALAAQPGAPVTLVDLSRNYGEHNAVMAGLAHARGDYAITMDDDLQNPPEEVRRLFEYTRDNDYDVVYTYYATKQHAAWRNIGSRFTNWCADRLIDKPRGLYLSSFRCVSAFLRERLVSYDGPYPYVDGLIFQITENVGRLQVMHLPRAEGRSNYTLRRLVRLWLSMFLNFSVLPLRVASVTGMVLSGCGLLGFLAVLIEALINRGLPTGWASLMSTVALLAGVQLMILGVVGEYLGRMFLTANRKPQYMVRRIYLHDGGSLVAHEPAAGSAASGRPYAGGDRAHISPVEAARAQWSSTPPLPPPLQNTADRAAE